MARFGTESSAAQIAQDDLAVFVAPLPSARRRIYRVSKTDGSVLSIASGRDVGLVLDLIQDDGHLYWVRELNGDRDLVTVSTGGGPVHQLARLDDYADSLVKVGATFFYGLAASSTDTSDQRTPRYNPSKDQGGIRKVSCTQ